MMEVAEESDVGVTAPPKDSNVEGEMEFRSPLKDLSNQYLHDITNSGSKYKAGPEETAQKLTLSSCDTPSEEQSESPACSTPHSSAYQDTTTDDYESADEGSPSKLNLSEVSTLLEKFHVTTPKNRSNKEFVFPYSPLEDNPFEESTAQSASDESTFVLSPDVVQSSNELVSIVSDATSVAQSSDCDAYGNDDENVPLQTPIGGDAISNKVEVSSKTQDLVTKNDSLVEETLGSHSVANCIISTASSNDLYQTSPSSQLTNDQSPLNVPILTPTSPCDSFNNMFASNSPQSLNLNYETTKATKGVNGCSKLQVEESEIHIEPLSPSASNNDRSDASYTTGDEFGTTVIEIQQSPQKDVFSDSWEVVESIAKSQNAPQAEGFILLDKGAVDCEPQNTDGVVPSNDEVIEKSVHDEDINYPAASLAENLVAEAIDLGTEELSKVEVSQKCPPNIDESHLLASHAFSAEESITVLTCKDDDGTVVASAASSTENGCMSINGNDSSLTVNCCEQSSSLRMVDCRSKGEAEPINSLDCQDMNAHQVVQTPELCIVQDGSTETGPQVIPPSKDRVNGARNAVQENISINTELGTSGQLPEASVGASKIDQEGPPLRSNRMDNGLEDSCPITSHPLPEAPFGSNKTDHEGIPQSSKMLDDGLEDSCPVFSHPLPETTVGSSQVGPEGISHPANLQQLPETPVEGTATDPKDIPANIKKLHDIGSKVSGDLSIDIVPAAPNQMPETVAGASGMNHENAPLSPNKPDDDLGETHLQQMPEIPVDDLGETHPVNLQQLPEMPIEATATDCRDIPANINKLHDTGSKVSGDLSIDIVPVAPNQMPETVVWASGINHENAPPSPNKPDDDLGETHLQQMPEIPVEATEKDPKGIPPGIVKIDDTGSNVKEDSSLHIVPVAPLQIPVSLYNEGLSQVAPLSSNNLDDLKNSHPVNLSISGEPSIPHQLPETSVGSSEIDSESILHCTEELNDVQGIVQEKLSNNIALVTPQQLPEALSQDNIECQIDEAIVDGTGETGLLEQSIRMSANCIADMLDSVHIDLDGDDDDDVDDDDLMKVHLSTQLADCIARECDTTFSRPSPVPSCTKIVLDEMISPKKPPRQLRFSIGNASVPPAMNRSFVIASNRQPKSGDLSQIMASCSKQEQELGSQDFGVISQAFDERMMQSSLTAEINSSEAGPITADEDLNKEECFFDPKSVDLDYLSQKGGKSDISRLTRQSLYIKFDPLVAESLALHEEDSESQMADNQSSSMEEKKDEPSRQDEERLIHLTPKSIKKEKDVKQTAGSHTPSLRAEISKLQELMIQQEQAHQEKAELVEELRQRIAELETTESTSGSADLEKQLAAKNDELNRVKKELKESTSNNKQLVQVMEEYEKTISQLVAIKEESKAKFESEKELIAAERDQALTHLSNMELAFNDIHQKYERAKGVIETFHANEVELKKSYDSIVDTVEKQKQAYQKFKAHAADTLQKANAEVDRVRRELSGEVARHKALLKKSELKCKSLEESLDQKKKELREMTDICDELISKVHR